MRGYEDVAGKERFEVYQGEGAGGCVEDLGGSLVVLALCCFGFGSMAGGVVVLGRLR